MTTDTPEFQLSVTIPAADLAALQRRVVYLEAVLVQLLRDGQRIKEWFSVADLVELRLPGMPTAKNAITRAGRDGRWRVRKVKTQGGERHEYHFSAFPRRSFEALIDRVLSAVPEGSAMDLDAIAAPTLAPPPPLPPKPDSEASPPWLLPLLRIIKRKGVLSIDQAMADLPASLPNGVACPSVEEALKALRNLGMVS